MRMIKIIAVFIALTVTQLGHAQEVKEVVLASNSLFDNAVEMGRDQIGNIVQVFTQPWITFAVTPRDEECLARNIYFEAGSEPEEGKAAVGIVTINRVRDGRFGNTICSVVNQRTVFVRSTVVKETEMVHTGWFGGTKPVVKNRIVINYAPVCQFSWVCAFVRIPRVSNPAWEQSHQIAHDLLANEYTEYRAKYNNALYFHSTGVQPQWSHTMSWIARVGRHIFYTDKI